MTDKMRWRYGDTNPVVAAVDAATVIEIGDLVWQDTDDAKPAAVLADHSSQAANQAGPGRRLSRRGHAAQPQRRRGARSAWQPRACSSSTAPSGTFELGDLIGADKNAANNGLLNQQVAKVAQSQVRDRPGGQAASRRPPPACWSTSAPPIMTGGVEGGSQQRQCRGGTGCGGCRD